LVELKGERKERNRKSGRGRWERELIEMGSGI
jgi:hypothetical protein